jgi:signal peptidase I
MNRITIVVAVVSALCITATVIFFGAFAVDAGEGARSFRTVTHSMEPALLAGERFSVRAASPQSLAEVGRGDIVAYRFPPDPAKMFVHRVVAVSGDTVGMVRGVLFIDGRPVAEPFVSHVDPSADPTWDDFRWQSEYVARSAVRDTSRYRPSRDNWGPLVVPSGDYFVLGDNRDNSLDGRYWGFLPASDIVGLPRRVVFSRDPQTGSVRWGRTGHLLD